MKIKEYGHLDADITAYNFLLDQIASLGEVSYIVHHQRKPPNAKPCQKPNSLLVQAVMRDGSVISVTQPGVGREPRLVKGMA